eukprot:jgi/Ulvmu1/12244/UM086_0035.1
MSESSRPRLGDRVGAQAALGAWAAARAPPAQHSTARHLKAEVCMTGPSEYHLHVGSPEQVQLAHAACPAHMLAIAFVLAGWAQAATACILAVMRVCCRLRM